MKLEDGVTTKFRRRYTEEFKTEAIRRLVFRRISAISGAPPVHDFTVPVKIEHIIQGHKHHDSSPEIRRSRLGQAQFSKQRSPFCFVRLHPL